MCKIKAYSKEKKETRSSSIGRTFALGVKGSWIKASLLEMINWKTRTQILQRLGKTKHSKEGYSGLEVLLESEISRKLKHLEELKLSRKLDNKLIYSVGNRNGLRKREGLPKTGRTRTNNNTIRKKK